MLDVSATEIAKRFSQYRQVAQREPAAVTHRKRVTEVLVSKHDYDEYVRLKEMATRSLWLHELSSESIAALMDSCVDSRHDHLDALMTE